MMKTTISGVGALALLLTVGGADVLGQQGRGAERPERPGMLTRGAGGSGAPGVEAILRMRDRLELSDEQIARLDELRAERVERRAAEAAALGEVRSQLRAGTIDRAAARTRMLELRETRQGLAETDRAAVEEILGPEQEEALQELRDRRRAFEAGRRSALRERARAPRDRELRPERSRGARGLRGGS